MNSPPPCDTRSAPDTSRRVDSAPAAFAVKIDSPDPASGAAAAAPRLLDRMRDEIRVRRCSIRTEGACVEGNAARWFSAFGAIRATMRRATQLH